MEIIITIANDISCNDANNLMNELNIEVLKQDKFKFMISDVKVVP